MYQSRYNSIPLIGLQGIRTNQFNDTLLSMSIRTQFICSNASLSMSIQALVDWLCVRADSQGLQYMFKGVNLQEYVDAVF